MRSVLCSLLVLSLFTGISTSLDVNPSGGLRAQGIEFFPGTWEEALAKAAAEDKLIFVDAYASWCGPCKAMSRNVFPQAEVGAFFNSNFINMKFDMEKEESAAFRKKHSVSAYPTLFFINGKNDVVHKSVGGKQVATLIEAGKVAISKMDDISVLAARWEDGDRTPKLAFKYIRALVRQQQPHAKIANDYLRTQQDFSSADHLNLLLVAATDADSRIFDLLVANKAAAIALVGKKAFDAQVAKAVQSTLAKAVEFRSEDLLEIAEDKMTLSDPDEGKRVALQGTFEIAARGTDLKAFQKATKKYLNKGTDGDIVRLEGLYQTAISSRFKRDEKVLDMAVRAGAAAAAGDPETGYRRYYKLADTLRELGKKDMALTYANLALQALPEEQPNYERAIQGLIDRIQKG